MLPGEPLLVIFLRLIDRIPMPEEAEKRRRGRPVEGLNSRFDLQSRHISGSSAGSG